MLVFADVEFFVIVTVVVVMMFVSVLVVMDELMVMGVSVIMGGFMVMGVIVSVLVGGRGQRRGRGRPSAEENVGKIACRGGKHELDREDDADGEKLCCQESSARARTSRASSLVAMNTARRVPRVMRRVRRACPPSPKSRIRG